MENSTTIFSAMQEGTPYTTLKKGILGKVALNVLNPFTREPEVLILEGNPANNDEGCFLDVWNAEQLMFVRTMNKTLFEKGIMLESERRQIEEPTESELLNSASDEELDAILNSKWLAFTAKLNKMTSPAPLSRILLMAREQEKSEKTIQAIEARLSEV